MPINLGPGLQIGPGIVIGNAPTPPSFIITQFNDFIVTEFDDFLVTEN
jgi:hypothetical protein